MTFVDVTQLPAEALATLRQGDREIRAHNIAGAAISYARVRNKFPSVLLPRLLEGVALLSSSQPQKALTTLRKAVQLERGNNLIAFRLLQGALVDSGDSPAADALERDMARRDLTPSVAIRHLLEWAQVLPESPTLLLLLGDAYQLGEEWKDAERAYQKAMTLAPRWVRPRMNSAMALLTQGRAPEASRRLEEALKLEPSNDQTRFVLGDAYLSAGRPKDAISAYEKVQRASPLAVQAQLNIAQAHVYSNNLSAATNSVNNAVKMAPEDPVTRAAQGEMQMRGGDYPRAAASFSTALRKADASLRPLLLRQLAQAELQDKRYDAARQTIQQGMTEAVQNMAPWYCLLARVARGKSDSEGVEAALRNALETDNDLYATETLAEIERSGLAGKLLSAYQSLWQNTSNGVNSSSQNSQSSQSNRETGRGGFGGGLTVKSVPNTPSARVRNLQALAHLARNASQYGVEVRVREDLIRQRPTVAEYYLLALAYDHNSETPNALAHYNKTRQMLEKQPGTLPRSEVEHLLGRIRVLKNAR
jgi:tetratricopeptide (TPR) repeat protein